MSNAIGLILLVITLVVGLYSVYLCSVLFFAASRHPLYRPVCFLLTNTLAVGSYSSTVPRLPPYSSPYIPFPYPGIPHGGPLGRRTRPAAAHAAPEAPW